MSQVMKAVRVAQWCAPADLVLGETAKPVAGPGEALVRVGHAALNFPDMLKIAGKHQNTPELPFTPGTEFSGEVEALGPGVEGFEVGQRVFAHTGQGAFAEYISVGQDLLRHVPEAMGDDDAAVFSLVYETSYIALKHRAQLQPGETVLVHSAAGGVGLAAVQIAKALGAGKIIATAGSDEKLEVVREHGANVVVNYESGDFVEVVKAETDGRGADVIYDPVGGEVGERSTKCIAPEGRLLLIGFTSGAFPKFRSNHMLVKNYGVIGFYIRHTKVAAKERCWRELLALYDSGQVKPVICRRYPVAQVGDAMAFLASREAVGKILLHW